jgi:ABC-type transport system involved in multi-copper enzyme maturation permease subunit
MVNLFLKDILLLKKGMLWLVGLWLFFIIAGKGFGFQYMVVTLLIAAQPMSVDEKNRTESLFVSLPVKRTSIVIERYIFMMLAIVAVVVVTYFSGRLLNILFPANFTKVIPIKELLAGQLPVMFFLSVAFPLFFRFGSRLETGIKVIIISVMVIFGSMLILFIIFTNLDIYIFRVKLIYNYLGVGVIVLGSLGISLWIYKRREF